MTEEVEKVVTPEPSKIVQPPAAEPLKTELAEHMIPKSRLDEVLKAKEKAEGELQKFLDAEKKRKDADLSELEKSNKHAAELEVENKKLKRTEMQRAAAEKFKLPSEFVTRLVGETPEEMEADAEKLSKAVPNKSTPGNPTNPGNAHLEETQEQKRTRLLGERMTNPFEKGGGVVWNHDTKE